VGSIKETYAQYPHLGAVLPAVGYGENQIAELEETINNTPCDAVLIGTPIDLRRVIKVNKPTVRVKYELQVLGPVCLEEVLEIFSRDA
jgi:predicted GTPase